MCVGVVRGPEIVRVRVSVRVRVRVSCALEGLPGSLVMR